MSSLTIFIVSPGSSPIMSALKDFAALGLVSSYLWMPHDGREGHVTVVEGGRGRHGSLEEELALRDPDLVRVVAVTHWRDAAGGRATLDVGERVLRTLPPDTRRTHVIIAEPGGLDEAPVVGSGWNNVVVSPEDGFRPGAHHKGWSTDAGAAEQGRRLLHTLAALAGVLRDHDETWTDQLSPNGRVRVVRAYYRRLDGRGVERSVHTRLFTMDGGLPRVWGNQGQGTYFSEPYEAATAMAKNWWSHARSDLLTPRQSLPSSEQTSIGLGAALKLFFTFILNAILRAPGQWVRAQIRAARDRLTSAVQGHVFGDNSAYQVVLSKDARFGGKRAEVTRALASLDSSLPRVAESREKHEQAWRELIEGALILADGATGASAMSFQESSEPQTVAKVSSIVPARDEGFEISSWDVRRRLGHAGVEPGDSMGFHRLRHELHRLTGEANLGAAASTELEALTTWWHSHRFSYAARTADLLARAHSNAIEEIQELSTRLRQDDEQLALQEEELAADQKRARRGVIIWFLMGIGFAVLFVVLGVLSIIIAGLAAALASLAIGTAVLGAFATFYRSQRRLFHVLHQMEQTSEHAPILQANLSAAVGDARRTLQAYEIHQEWLKVLRHFLQDPFGAGNLALEEDLNVSSPLPLAAAVGMGTADETLVAREVLQLQRRHFGQGWLHPLWSAYLDALPAHLGEGGVHLESGREILSMRSDDAQTDLHKVVGALDAKGAPTIIGDSVWQLVLEDLRIAQNQGRELLPKVRLLGSGDVLSREEFNRRFTRAGSSTPFRQDLFGAVATRSGMNLEEGIWTSERKEGISESLVMVSYSPAMSPDNLIRFAEPGHQDAADREPEPRVTDDIDDLF